MPIGGADPDGRHPSAPARPMRTPPDDRPVPAPRPLGDWLRRLRRLRPTPAPLPLAGDARRVPADLPPGPVDVIVPIHGAADALERCLRSLLGHTDLTRHRLLLVLDGPQPAAVGALVAATVAGAGAGGGGDGESGGGVLALDQPERQGFVASVNRGMAESARDVVLLNSDTQVTAGWLEKLQRAAYSASEIATATPFSNRATICSLPRFLESNELPAGWDADRFGRLVEERALPAYPRLPTGVGVCLYLKRKALVQMGPFDRRSFGLGYGEESEFCMRALKAGYAHVLDDATFVFHEGHRSFGSSRHARIAAAHRRLARLHPEYLATVARFLRDDPLAPLRERVIEGLAPGRRPAGPAGAGGGAATEAATGAATGPAAGAIRPGAVRPGAPARVLHLVHGWPPWSPSGTESYAAWLVRRQAEHREVTVLGRIADPERGRGEAIELLDAGARVRLLVRNFDERDPRPRNALASRPVERELDRLLAETRPQLVHVHHLAGLAASLPARVRRRGIPLVYQLQDWWTPCARANLLDRERRLCSGPAPGKCARCLPLTGRPPAALWNRLLYRYRAAVAGGALRGAGAYVMGSRFIRDSYVRLGLLRPDDPVYVLPYGVELAPPAERPPRRPEAALRFGVIGSILPHKGIHVAVAAFAGIDPRRARLTVWGDPTIAPDYTRELAALGAELAPEVGAAVRGEAGDSGHGAPGSAADGAGGDAGSDSGAFADRVGRVDRAVTLAGPFAEARKAEVFAAMDVLIVPSLGLESFGLVAREAMHHGVPVLASRRGALIELFERGAGDAEGAAAEDTWPGALFAPGDVAELRRWVDRLLADPELLARWVRRLPAVKGAGEHAEEIEEVYRRLLAGAAPGPPEGAGR
jgi:glycosyltransferase involved in cell wall biosynthesis/GT2 family glycosyltransferase